MVNQPLNHPANFLEWSFPNLRRSDAEQLFHQRSLGSGLRWTNAGDRIGVDVIPRDAGEGDLQWRHVTSAVARMSAG